jgi:hypothetical protein
MTYRNSANVNPVDISLMDGHFPNRDAAASKDVVRQSQ